MNTCCRSKTSSFRSKDMRSIKTDCVSEIYTLGHDGLHLQYRSAVSYLGYVTYYPLTSCVVRFLAVSNGCSAWRALGTAKTVTRVP